MQGDSKGSPLAFRQELPLASVSEATKVGIDDAELSFSVRNVCS